jgi:hypothetical protein
MLSTTLSEADRRFELIRTEDEAFFQEWQNLPLLSLDEQTALDASRRRYLYQRSEGHLLEGTVTLFLTSPLLTAAGFYDPPFRVRAGESVVLILNDGEDVLRGRIDVLVILNQLWVVVLESKKTALSVWGAVPQTLAYLMANPRHDRPSFGIVTNGDEILFIKLLQGEPGHYDFSRVFSPLSSRQELYGVVQILKGLAQVIQNE